MIIDDGDVVASLPCTLVRRVAIDADGTILIAERPRNRGPARLVVWDQVDPTGAWRPTRT